LPIGGSSVSGAKPGERLDFVTSSTSFTHPPREDPAETMTDTEAAGFSEHFGYPRPLLDRGTLVLVGPTLRRVNTGVTILEAPDRASAEAIMAADAVRSSGIVTPGLREMRVSSLRGR